MRETPVRLTPTLPDHTSPSEKGDEMAVSKDTLTSLQGANPLFLELFRASNVSAEREQAWRDAVGFATTGVSQLRFPLYERLYQLNECAQRMVELLEDLSSKFSINPETMPYRQALIQYVRATTSQDVVDFMSGVELTEEWLFEGLRRKEEDRLRDPDDVYVTVRHREKERAQEGFPPRIRFLDEPPGTKTPTATKAKAGKAS
jgi:hypothetical protein